MTHYQLLGIETNASEGEVIKAYRALAKKHHSDKTGGDDTIMKELTVAYRILGNADQRANYDNQLERARRSEIVYLR